MTTSALLLASVLLTTPEGVRVCTVTPPELGADARLETTNVLGCTAWRIHYAGAGEKMVANEEWRFDFGEDLVCWPVSHAQGEYVPKTLSTIADVDSMPGRYRGDGAGKGSCYEHLVAGSSESPLTVEGRDFTAVIGDAGVLDYSRIRLLSGAQAGTVRAVLEGPSTVQLPYTTPWRYVHVAKDCAAVAQDQPAVLRALNAPSRVADTSWIRPGKVLRVAKLTTASALQCVDFAARNGFAHIELDSGWYGDERRGNPLVPGLAPEKIAKGEELDVFRVIAAAQAKGLGTILYVNREPLKQQAAAIFDAFRQWGVAGVKFGFVNVGGQRWRKQVIDWIELCAERKLMVDIHDEFRLTGIQRTYPHVLTVEGIRGNEEMPGARHNAALVYTRFLDGPGDYTPCWRVGRVKNTLAHQLAMPAVYTSGWQFLFWYSRPDQIDDREPALAFWREIPTVFDEVRHLQGKIGEFAVVARHAGEQWFVGCLNAGEVRAFKVPLSFAAGANVPAAPLRVRLFRDAEPANGQKLAPVAVEELSLTAADALEVTAAANGGWAAMVEAR
ncbi:MAG: glycoside hydrolase family 97 catalytic domain-containing protein [Kiritimatiellia bacterium]